jgi:hypothetical protein
VSLQLKSVLSSWFYFTVAVAAVYRFARAGFKRYLGVFAALGTFCGEHLSRGAVATGTTVTAAIATLGLLGLATRWAALWLVGVAFGLVEFLLFSGEVEGSPTIGTAKCLILETH